LKFLAGKKYYALMSIREAAIESFGFDTCFKLFVSSSIIGGTCNSTQRLSLLVADDYLVD
jgi:hypothetical protein